jgi:hypothetical protein
MVGARNLVADQVVHRKEAGVDRTLVVVRPCPLALHRRVVEGSVDHQMEACPCRTVVDACQRVAADADQMADDHRKGRTDPRKANVEMAALGRPASLVEPQAVVEHQVVPDHLLEATEK